MKANSELNGMGCITADEKIEVSSDGLWQLQSAARDFARAEIDRIVGVVIEELRSRPPIGTFDEIHARHFWDEYCWALQQGPWDEPIIIGDINFGSFLIGFESLLHALVSAEVDKRPKHEQVFMSVLAAEEDPDIDEEKTLCSLWVDGIVTLITNAVNERAAHRSLYLIGPDRADVVGHELHGTGFVWSVLGQSVAMGPVQNHVDTMIDPGADLSLLADELVETYLTAARDDEDGVVSIQLLEHFEDKIRSMIIEHDLLPSLEVMRRKLLGRLDG